MAGLDAVCCKCGTTFTPPDYQIRKSNYQCRDCVNTYKRAWTAKRKAEGRPVICPLWPLEKRRAYYAKPEVRARRRAWFKARMADPVEYMKLLARKRVRSRVRRGTLVPGPCAQCGSTEQIHAHHEDYSRPLDVAWLCMPCHKAVHKRRGR
jgi:hypothetical protein